MKKVIFVITFLIALITIDNQAFASSKMIAITGDYKLNLQTFSPYELKINEFYAGVPLKDIYLNEYLVYVSDYKGTVTWENPEYVLEVGYQLVNLIFIKEDGKKMDFTIGIYCEKNFVEVVRPLIY